MRNFIVTSNNLYQDYPTIFEMTDRGISAVKKHYPNSTPSIIRDAHLYCSRSHLLPFVYRLAFPEIVRSCILDGRYKDLACAAFVSRHLMQDLYKKIFADQHRRDAFRARLVSDYVEQSTKIHRLSKTFQLLDTLLDFFVGNEEYVFDYETPVFQFTADPNPSWDRDFEPWEWRGDLAIDLVPSKPVFEDERDYKSIVTGNRFGDRTIVVGSETEGVVSTTYYRNHVLTIKAVDSHENCQGTKSFLSSSKNWFVINCLIRACLGEDAGIYFLVDSKTVDVTPRLQLSPYTEFLWEHDPKHVMNSATFKKIIQ